VTYIWQRNGWPIFYWDAGEVNTISYRNALEASNLVGSVRHLSDQQKMNALIDLMVSEAVTTSKIEGEIYHRDETRFSIRNQLNLNLTPAKVLDANANGVASFMISVRNHFAKPLTAQRLCEWQNQIIVEDYRRSMLETGKWRTSTKLMQIVSGVIGKEKVHYEAPPSTQVSPEKKKFIQYFFACHLQS